MNQAAATKPCSTEELKKEEQVTLKLQKRIGLQKEKALEIKTMTGCDGKGICCRMSENYVKVLKD